MARSRRRSGRFGTWRQAMPLARLAFYSSCSGPRSPQSRRRLVAVPPRSRPAPAAFARRAGFRTAAAVVPARGLVAPGARARRAAVRGRLPDLAAAHRRPRRAHVPRRPVRRGGLHDLERPVVRRPPHARLQHHLAADRVAARPAVGPGACRAGLGRPLRAARPRLLRRGALALGLDLVRRGHRHPALHQPAAVRDRRGVRAGRPARPAAAPLRAGDRLRLPLPARQPRGRALPRDGGRGLRARPPRRPHRSGARASPSRPPRSSRRCSSPGPSRRAAGRPSRSRPTCRSRCSRSPA